MTQAGGACLAYRDLNDLACARDRTRRAVKGCKEAVPGNVDLSTLVEGELTADGIPVTRKELPPATVADLGRSFGRPRDVRKSTRTSQPSSPTSQSSLASPRSMARPRKRSLSADALRQDPVEPTDLLDHRIRHSLTLVSNQVGREGSDALELRGPSSAKRPTRR